MTEPGLLRLDLELHPDDLNLLTKTKEVESLGKPQRAVPVRLVWYDTPDCDLARRGLALAERHIGRETLWRLERTRPDGHAIWIPGTLARPVAEAPDRAGLGHSLPEPLLAVAAFEGQSRRIGGAAVELTVLSGVLRAVASERALCRVALEGPPGSVLDLAQALAQTLRLGVPDGTLADAAHVAAGRAASDPRRGAPALPPSLAVGDAFAHAVAHLAGVIQRHAAEVGVSETPEPVHQLRVAVRRLRSVAKLFRRAAACPELDVALAALADFGHALGPARDWDVFTLGTAREVAAAFPHEPAVQRLAALAGRRRDATYAALAAYLASPAFRQLGLTLAGLAATRPWERVAAEALAGPENGEEPPVRQTELLAMDPARFAAKALAKRHKRLMAPGPEIASLSSGELHAIRLDGKRMRYAGEIFAPLFPGKATRRFLRRLASLQERLGHLNDGAVAAGLLDEIGQSRGLAGGVVRGYVAAGGADARRLIDRAWHKLHGQDQFWT